MITASSEDACMITALVPSPIPLVPSLFRCLVPLLRAHAVRAWASCGVRSMVPIKLM